MSLRPGAQRVRRGVQQRLGPGSPLCPVAPGAALRSTVSSSAVGLYDPGSTACHQPRETPSTVSRHPHPSEGSLIHPEPEFASGHVLSMESHNTWNWVWCLPPATFRMHPGDGGARPAPFMALGQMSTWQTSADPSVH